MRTNLNPTSFALMPYSIRCLLLMTCEITISYLNHGDCHAVICRIAMIHVKLRNPFFAFSVN